MRCALTHTPKPSQLDVRFYKTQRQPNVKHIASQQQLGGEERAAQHPDALGRASSRLPGEEGQPVSLPKPLQPLFPCSSVPRPSPSLLGAGGHLGARCGAPASVSQGAEGAGGRPLDPNSCGHWNVGSATHVGTVISGKFPNLSEPSRQHPHTRGLPKG